MRCGFQQPQDVWYIHHGLTFVLFCVPVMQVLLDSHKRKNPGYPTDEAAQQTAKTLPVQPCGDAVGLTRKVFMREHQCRTIVWGALYFSSSLRRRAMRSRIFWTIMWFLFKSHSAPYPLKPYSRFFSEPPLTKRLKMPWNFQHQVCPLWKLTRGNTQFKLTWIFKTRRQFAVMWL